MRVQNRCELAPIVVFAYNRLDEIQRMLYALAENDLAEKSDLYIFSDAAKYTEDIEKVKKVRVFLEAFKREGRFKKTTIREASQNRGLADSIIYGVTQIINLYGDVIVLEDDCIPTSDFLRYMNAALEYYQNDNRIWSITGYAYDLPSLKDYPYDVYLSYRGCSWGWGTWKHMWHLTDWAVQDYKEYRFNIKSRVRFMRGGNDLPSMLKAQMNGKIDSWAVRWCFSQSMLDKLTVYPKESRILNIGFQNGTHKNNKSKTEARVSGALNVKERECHFADIRLDNDLVKDMSKLWGLTLRDRIIGFLKLHYNYHIKRKKIKHNSIL